MSAVAVTEKAKAPRRCAPGSEVQNGPSLRAERRVRKPARGQAQGQGLGMEVEGEGEACAQRKVRRPAHERET